MRTKNQNQDTAVQADQELVKVKRKKKQHLPTFIKVILIILILNAAPKIVQMGFLLYDKIYDPPLLGIVVDQDAYIQRMKNKQSDIAGMSVYDKEQMGLKREDGSDTDYDGLTDKEEIETYHSDPLQASTSGDLFTDGYKVAHGMDLFTKYPYDQEMEFQWNECQEIILGPKSPLDFYANIQDVTNSSEFTGYNTIKAYYIYNYAGDLSIDLTSFLSEKRDLKDIKILIKQDGSDYANLVKFKKQENTAILSYSFDSNSSYTLYISTGSRLSAAKNMFLYYIERRAL